MLQVHSNPFVGAVHRRDGSPGNDGIREKAKSNGATAFLIDARGVRNRKTPTNDYVFAHRLLDQLGISRDSRVAILVTSGDTTHDFFEVIASDAGYAWRVFDDEGEAIDWLQ